VRFDTGEQGCAAEESVQQFCAVVDAPLAFPSGETLLSARLLDTAGRAGPIKQMILRVGPR
jgi:hypothetical protein